ncbi:ribosomal protein S18 [Coniella lustricola]|uniref:Small ribosomal subunit protein bS18m n=1 Tax=Coniella lustricola TaxID=2025994 RepID=A0A2T3AH82_9PEZI|nr:ribosomal protein S18 [Coniella lustricola]
MSARPLLRPLVRSLQAPVVQARASISSTAKNKDIQGIGAAGPSASRSLLDFDDKTFTTNSSNAAKGNSDKGEALHNLMQRRKAFDSISDKKQVFEERVKGFTERGEFVRQATRTWKEGDVYAPKDLSSGEMKKWKQPKKPTKDILDMVGINPLDHYKNFGMISEYMTNMGRIKHSSETGLRPVNQRKMAKAIRRAIGMGIHPSTHKHPEILFTQTQAGPRYQNTKIPDPEKNKVRIK